MSSTMDSVKFKRAYRACLNCRVRKVKCDLGSADSPRLGKCARCLRERKDCVFIERKRTQTEAGPEIQRAPESVSEPTGGLELQSGGLGMPGSVDQSRDAVGVRVQPLEAVSLRYNKGGSKLPVSQMLNYEGQEASQRGSQSPTGNGAREGRDNQEQESSNTMAGALAYLANAVGSMATADERDNIDAKQRALQIEQIDRSSSQTPSVKNGDSNNIDQNAKPISSREELARDKPEIFSRSSESDSVNESNSKDNIDSGAKKLSNSIPPLLSHLKPGRMIMPPAESIFATRPKAADNLANIDYIGPLSEGGLLTVQEARRLINLFFTTMHPFFPHLPIFLRNPDVLPQYPILLCTIITIACRYHPFENNVGNSQIPRHIEVHDRLWLYVQRLISQTVWAEASTRSIGTVFAFLLFTEWNPRAIHWRWADYANKAEDETANGSGNPNSNTEKATASNSAATGDASSSSNGAGGSLSNHYEQNLAGFGAMRRSDRMGWMLIGSAVRLAQDMGFMDVSAKTFLATHIAEINSVMNISRRSMLAQSLLEIEIDDDDDENEIEMDLREEIDNHSDDYSDEESGRRKRKKTNNGKWNRVEEDFDSKVFTLTEEAMKRLAAENSMKFTKSQKAQIELLQIMSLGHESLYGYKARLGELTQRQSLSVLSILSPLISSWGRKYKLLLVPITPKFQKYSQSLLQKSLLDQNSKVAVLLQEAILRESFIFEYNYLKLYIYSLALSPTKGENGNDGESKKKRKKTMSKFLKLEEMANSTKYIEQAFNAASEMLNVANRVHRLKLLRYMPTRWLTRIVRAIAFIVKCYMTITAHKKSGNSQNQQMAFDVTVLSLSLITTEEIMHSIQRAALCLRDSSPDELHLCTRYSNILMYLYSQMKSKSMYLGVSVPNRTASTNKNMTEPRTQENDNAYSPQAALVSEPSRKVNRVYVTNLPVGSVNNHVNESDYFYPTQNQGQLQQRQQPPPPPPQQQQQQVQLVEFETPSFADPAQQYDSFDSIQPPPLGQQNSQSQMFSFPSLFDRVDPAPNSNITTDGTNSPVSGILEEPMMEWLRNEHTIGLEFVGPWTEMIEQRLDANEPFAFGEF